MNILFSGMLAADPHQGGATWAVLQYLLGLRRLGHRVCFVEPVNPAKIRPTGATLSASDNARYFREVVTRFGLEEDAALLLEGTQKTAGLSYDALITRAGSAELLLNVSGMLKDERLLERIPTRVFLDLDPAFVQIWHANYNIDMGFARHTHFVTVGREIGQPHCPVPTCGVMWMPTLQPVDLSHWPVADVLEHDALTTIANWRGYGSVEHQGVFYGQKAHSLRQFIDLPTRTDETFLLALSIHPADTKDVESLAKNGWRTVDPAVVAGTPDDYQRFVAGSKAEFGIAKAGYVASRCGWFSDRSACYLASGRPVIAQDTGFARSLPTGAGLFAFATAEDVLAAIEAIASDYPAHRRAARDIALEFFDSNRVLPRLLDQVTAAPPAPEAAHGRLEKLPSPMTDQVSPRENP
jgi:hypothetical protein